MQPVGYTVKYPFECSLLYQKLNRWAHDRRTYVTGKSNGSTEKVFEVQ